MSVVIGIDPAKRSGVAGMVDARLVHLAVATSQPFDPWPKIDAIRRALIACGVSTTRGGSVADGTRVLLQVEAQFLGKPDGFGGKADGRFFNSSASVAQSAAVWQAVALLLGCKLGDPVYPKSWQALIGVSSWSQEQREAALVDFAQDALGAGLDAFDGDKLAAIFLALYGSMRENGWNAKPDTECASFGFVRECRRANQLIARQRRKGTR